MSYQPPFPDVMENDPHTVRSYIPLIPPEKQEGKSEKEIMDLAKEQMIKYRIPLPNDSRKKVVVYGGRKRTRKYKKSLKKRKSIKKIIKKKTKKSKSKRKTTRKRKGKGFFNKLKEKYYGMPVAKKEKNEYKDVPISTDVEEVSDEEKRKWNIINRPKNAQVAIVGQKPTIQPQDIHYV